MKTLVVYFGIGLIHIIALLPISVARRIGKVFGLLLWYSNSGSAKVTKANIKHCFSDFSDKQVNELVKKSLIALGQTYAEMGMSWVWSVERVQRQITNIEGLELLQHAKEEKKGVVVIAPHLGNWEILNHFLRQHVKMTIMFKPAKIAALDRFIIKTRERVGCDLVAADKKGVLSLFKVLKEGGAIGVLPDQEPSLKSGVFAPFFGKTALTGKLTGDLGKRTQAAMLFCYAKRLENGHYCVVLKQASEDIRDADPLVSATALNKGIEECIMDCPEQYQWGYKRFRKQPEGKSGIYKKAA